MIKKEISTDNYLERIPVRSSLLKWSSNENGIVTLELENKGFFNFIAQKVFRKARTSYIHLDNIGSFVWPLIDGEKNILQLGELVDEKFGNDAYPLYERLSKFFAILDSYHFIGWAENSKIR